MIDCSNVRFTYDGERFVLRGIDLHIADGEFELVVPIPSQANLGGEVGVAEHDRPLRVARDVLGVGFLRGRAKCLPGNIAGHGAFIRIEHGGDGACSFFAVPQLAVLLVGRNLVGVKRIVIGDLAHGRGRLRGR